MTAVAARPGLPALVRRVLGSRVIAALASPHPVDRYLEQVDPSWSVDEVRAEIVDRRAETLDTTTLVLRPNRSFRGFRAGQWVELSVEIDGVRRTRCFSIASAERGARGDLELTIKRHAGGVVTPWLVAHAAPGTVVTLSQAQGDFTLPEPRPAKLLLVSGGSGITPCMSILRTLVEAGGAESIVFVHVARTRADVIFREELEDLAARHPGLTLHVLLTGGGARPDGAAIAALAPDHAERETYVCGPAGLIDRVAATWVDRGLGARLHVERFGLAAPPSLSPGAGGTVRFAGSGATVRDDGRVLLAQAEAAGLSPPSGCRMGICMTCKCAKAAGVVRDVRTGALSEDGREDIQLCVSVPVGDVTLDI